MKRQVLTDDTGSWFDLESAEKFVEATTWDGTNHISLATRSWTEHEALYRTKIKNWVLNTWSQYQNSRETWRKISNIEAARWLTINGHDHPDVAAEIANLKI